MAKNQKSDATATLVAAKRQIKKKDGTVVDIVKKPEPKACFIGTLEMEYLDAAVDKLCQPLHPNFVRAVKPATLAIYDAIRITCMRLQNSGKFTPKQIVMGAVRVFADDVRTYVTFLGNVMSNVAFAANLDVGRLERDENSPDVGQLESSVDAMGEEHDFDSDDLASFDRAMYAHAGTDGMVGKVQAETIADNTLDAYTAVEHIQCWLNLAVSTFSPGQLDYWQLNNGIPLCKRGAEENYAPIFDFDEYREYQKAQWQVRRSKVPGAMSVEQLLNAA